jgi:hypothetical protein
VANWWAVGSWLISGLHSAISACAVRSATRGDRESRFDGLGVWGESVLDFLVERRDRVVERVDVRQRVRLDHPGVLTADAAWERLA